MLQDLYAWRDSDDAVIIRHFNLLLLQHMRQML